MMSLPCNSILLPNYHTCEPTGLTQTSGVQNYNCLIVDMAIRFKDNKNAAGEFTSLLAKWNESHEEEWGWEEQYREEKEVEEREEVEAMPEVEAEVEVEEDLEQGEHVTERG